MGVSSVTPFQLFGFALYFSSLCGFTRRFEEHHVYCLVNFSLGYLKRMQLTLFLTKKKKKPKRYLNCLIELNLFLFGG